MPDHLTMEILQERFITGLLFFIRCLAMMVSAPFFSNLAVTPQIRVMLSLIVALAMSVAFGAEQPAVVVEPINMLVLVIKEVLVGVIIGYSTNLVFQAVRFAGGLIDFDMGYQTAVLFNADIDSPTLIGELKSLAALMLFLILNGHHFLIEAVYASVRAIPLTAFTLSGDTIDLLVRLVAIMFLIGTKIAAPILIALFVTNLALALLARVAPQINIFILSFQIKIIVGLVMLFLTVPLLMIVIKNALESFEHEIMKIIMSIQAAVG